MARSQVSTVKEYLDALEPERRAVVSAVRDHVKANLPKGYVETIAWGMIQWEIPLKTFADTHNKQPLGLVALAAQKQHYALYLTPVQLEPAREQQLRDAYERAGKRIDIGKSCLRFKRIEDVVLPAVTEAIDVPVEELVAMYTAGRVRH